jgi:glycosyltransferase involved in cell wall biosynthesis
VTRDSPESYDQLKHSGSKGLALDGIDSAGLELSELLRDKDCELREKDCELREKDRELHRELVEKGNIIAERQARIDRLTQILDSERAELERTLEQARDFARQLAAARNRPMKVLWDLLRYRLFSMLSNSPPLPGRTAARFAKSAEKRDPTRSVRIASKMRSGRNAPESTVSEEPLRTQRRPPLRMLDGGKWTVLVVSHEMSRTGAPILALNLIQQLTPRYNVITLTLGRGDVTDDFRNASNLLYEADRIHMTDLELRRVVKDITEKHSLSFAIVNSVESRMVLKALRDYGVPTVSLIHEFSSYVRPPAALRDIITLSTETVFSTKLTLENAVSDLSLSYPCASIHVAPQGKCTVPASPRIPSDASGEKEWLSKNLRPKGEKLKFLVIGVGSIELRKGVDLFIECATTLAAQPNGDRFQFVWIGNGFDPERDAAYSVFLADQIKRAGIELQLKILRSTSEIEFAYETADLLLLSSRLDPLPNVAIDALSIGLPVVCFEKTTGIADFLCEIGLAEHCVAKYLDTNDLARKVGALADSDSLRVEVSRRSRAAAESAFDMLTYVSKIEAIALQAVGSEERVNEEVGAIVDSGKFRGDFFKHSAIETLPEEKIVEAYVRSTALGLGVRKPMPGFHPVVYSLLRETGKTNGGDPFADFLRNELPPGPWHQEVIQNDADRNTLFNADLRVALHIHIFYPDQLADIVERLNVNVSKPDLFLSVSSREAASRARAALSKYGGRIVQLELVPNRGRDIGPLLTQFGRALCSSYDVIGHLHTKSSARFVGPSVVEPWKTFLLENLLGGEHGGTMLDLILSSMASNPAFGIVFPDDPNVLSWTGNRAYAEKLGSRMGCGKLPEHFNFPVGSMFWVRSAVLLKFVELDLQWSDYPSEPLPLDGTMLHAIERLLGIVPTAMGMACAVTNVRGVTR